MLLKDVRWIIVVRMPDGNVLTMSENDAADWTGNDARIMQFTSRAEAQALCATHRLLLAMPHQIVELEI